MNKQKLIQISFFNSLGTLVYISLVALIIRNGEKIFGEMSNITGPIAFLLLFVLSAAITASLVLGRPIYLYLDNLKKEAIQLFLFTIGWLFVFMVIMLAVNLIIK